MESKTAKNVKKVISKYNPEDALFSVGENDISADLEGVKKYYAALQGAENAGNLEGLNVDQVFQQIKYRNHVTSSKATENESTISSSSDTSSSSDGSSSDDSDNSDSSQGQQNTNGHAQPKTNGF